MLMREDECSAQDNRDWLLGHFAALLHAQEPESVLDVGCGNGLLMKACRERGIAAKGIDLPGPGLDALVTDGLDVREGSANALPFESGSMDWVTLRHVPHHLKEPAPAFAEALRVARKGVLLAEPCFDETLASQRNALALDHWEKRQHRRQGMFHADDLDVAALLALMPPGFEGRFDVEVHVSLRLRARSREQFAIDAAELVPDLPGDHVERVALAGLSADLERDGLTWNGSSCLLLTRR